MQTQGHENNDMRKIAGEQCQENNRGKMLPQRPEDSTAMAAWVKGCSRAAGGKPLELKKAKAPICNISLSMITDDALLTFN